MSSNNNYNSRLEKLRKAQEAKKYGRIIKTGKNEKTITESSKNNTVSTTETKNEVDREDASSSTVVSSTIFSNDNTSVDPFSSSIDKAMSRSTVYSSKLQVDHLPQHQPPQNSMNSLLLDRNNIVDILNDDIDREPVVESCYISSSDDDDDDDEDYEHGESGQIPTPMTSTAFSVPRQAPVLPTHPPDLFLPDIDPNPISNTYSSNRVGQTRSNEKQTIASVLPSINKSIDNNVKSVRLNDSHISSCSESESESSVGGEDKNLLVGFNASARQERIRSSKNEHQSNSVKKKESNQKVPLPPKTTETPKNVNPSIEPYYSKLEKFELFSTQNIYFLVACDKQKSYRILRIDRTLIHDQTRTTTAQSQIGSSSSFSGEVGPPPSIYPQSPSFSEAGTDISGHGNPHNMNHHKSTPLRQLSDFCVEDPHVYTQYEIQQVLDMIHEGNKNVGGLRPLVKAYGIVGFIKFLDCYYLTLITKRNKVGMIGENSIYSIKATETFPLKPAEKNSVEDDPNPNSGDPSSMLLNMWNRGKRAAGLGLTQREIAELRYQGLYQVVDLTKNFYFSYTYDITRSLQENFLFMTSQTFPPPKFKDMYAWNFFLTRELSQCTSPKTNFFWVLPVIHGAFVQRKISDYGRTLNLFLMARRSRHFAGTRYLKRGVSDRGKVANDVEHEQILQDETFTGGFSSFLQMRGSIPTYWAQESSVTMPKPPIVLNRVDPTYRATQIHFQDALSRYGSPIVVVDLVKQSEKREREVIVGNEYRHAIDYLNSYIDEDNHKIRYCALDYSHISKHRNLNVSTALNEVATWGVNQTGFFCSEPRWKITKEGQIEPFVPPEEINVTSQYLNVPVFPMEQNGVLRTNCIDCLDRTNVAQFSAGVSSLAQQLVVMGITTNQHLDPSSNIVRVLIDMYVEIGDHIALQYGGSEAHKKVSTDKTSAKEGPSAGKHKELLTSIRRYYSNAFTDRLKQDAMNLFLGYYIPHRHSLPLWDMESDYYLHNSMCVQQDTQSISTFEQIFAIDNWVDEEIEESPKNRRHKRIDSLDGINTRFDTIKNIEERILNVQIKYSQQKKGLSKWWKDGLRSYAKQRLLYRPFSNYSKKSRSLSVKPLDKISQFDKCFGSEWATPLRLSHQAQHAQQSSEDKDFLRSVTTPSRIEQKKKKSQGLKDTNLSDFLREYGYGSDHENNSLNVHFLNIEDEKKEDLGAHNYIGNLDNQVNYIDENEYIKYVKHLPTPGKFRESAKAEFTKCLAETNLRSDDVKGILNFAKSAHIFAKIPHGKYQDLDQSTSAKSVAALSHGYLNTSSSHELEAGHLNRYLRSQQQLDISGWSNGIYHQIIDGHNSLRKSEKAFHDILHKESDSLLVHHRSELTSEKSMKMYCSFYDSNSTLSRLNKMYILGRDDQEEESEIVDRVKPSKTTKISYESTMSFRDKEGFEQINEDLYARKENKFMVFNGVGVDTWYSGTQPITKIDMGILFDLPAS